MTAATAEKRHPHKTRIRYDHQWTVRTKSDHDALFVALQIRNRFGPWVRLLVCSQNMGGKFDEADLGKLLDHEPDVVALQEGGDQKWVEAYARRRGYRLIPDTGRAGQASTPLLVSEDVRIAASTWVKLLGAVWIGKGAGPDRSKPKWYDRNRLILAGVRFGASSIHLTVSQQFRERLRAALVEVSIIDETFDGVGRPMLAIGDSNSASGQPLRKAMIRKGWTTNAEQLGVLDTMGNRDIDIVATQARLCAPPVRHAA
jgi:endonuclease/exonuclease/phosphatase family metal-dependent hydrolase